MKRNDDTDAFDERWCVCIWLLIIITAVLNRQKCT